MKNIKIKMNLLMGATMSFLLSLIGLLSAGVFTPLAFFKNFIISFIISQILGFIIPIKKLSNSLFIKYNLTRDSLKGRLLDALLTTLTYSPIMTFIMVFIAYKNATSHGANIPFIPMLLRSELISFVCAFILSYLISPIYVKLLSKNR